MLHLTAILHFTIFTVAFNPALPYYIINFTATLCPPLPPHLSPLPALSPHFITLYHCSLPHVPNIVCFSWPANQFFINLIFSSLSAPEYLPANYLPSCVFTAKFYPHLPPHFIPLYCCILPPDHSFVAILVLYLSCFTAT